MERKRWPVTGLIMLFLVALGLFFLLSGRGAHSVVRVNRADPQLIAAIHEAQRRLPEFTKALSTQKPGQRFAVKGSFKTDSGPEYLWVRDPVVEGGGFKGVLDQVPIAATSLKKGDSVVVAKADVYDWLIMRDGKIEGEFTEQALGH